MTLCCTCPYWGSYWLQTEAIRVLADFVNVNFVTEKLKFYRSRPSGIQKQTPETVEYAAIAPKMKENELYLGLI